MNIAATNSGSLRIYGSNTYANLHDAANATEATNNTNIQTSIGQYRDSTGGEYYDLSRAGLEFSLSGVPSGIVSASVKVYGYEDLSDTNFNITLVDGSDLAATLVVADWGDLLNDTTSYGSLSTLGGFATEGWNTIPLNSTGITAIENAIASGVIRFGVRSSLDISSTPPTGDPEWQSVGWYGSGATASKKPLLVLTYAFVPKIFIF